MRNTRFGVLDNGIQLGSLGGGIFGGLLCMYSRSFRPVHPIRRTKDKVGRNQSCPCGSDRKHKNCCGGIKK